MPGMPAATPELAHSPLEPLLQRAGATMVARHGWWVAAHFGSPGGELALCDRAVGLADRSDLGKLELRGDESAVDLLVGQLSGGQISSGDALLAEGAWWCAISPGHVLALCDAAETEPPARRRERGRALDARGDGHRRHAALRRARAARPPHRRGAHRAQRLPARARRRLLPEFDVLRLASVPVLLLRGAPGRAVVLTEAARAAALWTEVERAGREAGIGKVGADAVSHLSPLARR